jgi:hypothetical protein
MTGGGVKSVGAVDNHVESEGVTDIFKIAGIDKADLSNPRQIMVWK